MADDDYKVGYGKAPTNSQFKHGESGNPKGRPKGTNNFKTDLTEELKERILVREGDRSIKISKQRAVIKSLVAKTLKGDQRAANTLLTAMFRLLDLDGAGSDADRPITADENEVLAVLQQRTVSRMKAEDKKDDDEDEGGNDS
ncbi:MAG: DUF5681 domain-containing protein [Candidatus Binataceae bacterium]|jgi:hypothetical protein